MAEEKGLKPLQEILKEFGGWPVVVGDNWNESNFEWAEMIYKFRRVGYWPEPKAWNRYKKIQLITSLM